MPLVRRTRATLRSAEFGFLGVVVYTRVHTPRRWGLPLSAGVLVLPTLSSRPLRTSCWIVGTSFPNSSLLLLFFVFYGSCRVVLRAGPRPPPALGRVAHRPQDRAPAIHLRGGPALRDRPVRTPRNRRLPGARNGPGNPRHEDRGYPRSVRSV